MATVLSALLHYTLLHCVHARTRIPPFHLQARHRKLLLSWVEAAVDAEGAPPASRRSGGGEAGPGGSPGSELGSQQAADGTGTVMPHIQARRRRLLQSWPREGAESAQRPALAPAPARPGTPVPWPAPERPAASSAAVAAGAGSGSGSGSGSETGAPGAGLSASAAPWPVPVWPAASLMPESAFRAAAYRPGSGSLSALGMPELALKRAASRSSGDAARDWPVPERVGSGPAAVAEFVKLWRERERAASMERYQEWCGAGARAAHGRRGARARAAATDGEERVRL